MPRLMHTSGDITCILEINIQNLINIIYPDLSACTECATGGVLDSNAVRDIAHAMLDASTAPLGPQVKVIH